ncbi:cytochrome b5-related protein-like [Chironomus tepperi]|uniref:cytochrome b5-related protein-like n=1 Tax=Chironomus tepperi TaxID=113505 RepID=UPI00391F851F
MDHSSVLNKYPTYRDSLIKGYWLYLEGRRMDDNAEGYWRVHDKLYDLEGFELTHPGGHEWISMTKGTDITELFESHHISPIAPKLLEKYFKKDADAPRNYNLTYDENGFYKTLKRRVMAALPTLDTSVIWISKATSDAVLCGFFIASILAARAEDFYTKLLLIALAAKFGAWIIPTSHNFNHQRNNWRRFNANFVMLGWRTWRTTHVISHHMYSNSFTDMEITVLEPFVQLLPVHGRSKLEMTLNYLLLPVSYFFPFHGGFIFRYLGIFYAKNYKLHWDEILVFLPPIFMFLLGSSSYSLSNLLDTLILWNIIIAFASFLFVAVAVSGGHHSPTIVHEGDDIKSMDFGIYQMLTTFDRKEAALNLPIAVLYFGDHVLHHLFPTLDQAVLPQLKDILEKTCKEFDVKYFKYGAVKSFFGLLKQISKTKGSKIRDVNINQK